MTFPTHLPLPLAQCFVQYGSAHLNAATNDHAQHGFVPGMLMRSSIRISLFFILPLETVFVLCREATEELIHDLIDFV
jgi:hypothetical protein